MKLRISCFLIIILLVAADSSKDEANKKDLALMQGDWAAESMTKDGFKLPDDDARALFRTVKENGYTVFRYDKPIAKWTFTIDATHKPKTIDIFPANAKEKANPLLGIYELEADTFKMCNAPAGKDRPSEFESKPGMTQTLTVWKREKK